MKINEVIINEEPKVDDSDNQGRNPERAGSANTNSKYTAAELANMERTYTNPAFRSLVKLALKRDNIQSMDQATTWAVQQQQAQQAKQDKRVKAQKPVDTSWDTDKAKNDRQALGKGVRRIKNPSYGGGGAGAVGGNALDNIPGMDALRKAIMKIPGAGIISTANAKANSLAKSLE